MTGFLVICIVHIAGIFLSIYYRKKGILKAEPVMLFVLDFIPIFGEICLLILYISGRHGHKGKTEADFDGMRKDETEDSVYHRRENEGDNTVVPLEDALILGDSGVRHSAMMDLLMDGSGNDIDAIRRAEKNTDTEVVHYATTAMTEISRKYDMRLQQAAARYKKEPESETALDSYIFVLRNYLNDNMAEGELLEIQRGEYRKLLRTRIQKTQSREDYADLASSLLDSGEYEEADKVISVMEEKWMHREETLNLRLRYLYEYGTGEQIRKLIRKVKEDEYIPESVEEIIRFWETASSKG